MLACAAPSSLGLQQHLWRVTEDGLARGGAGARSGGAAASDALGWAFLPAALAPGHLSRAALASALETLGCGVSRDSALQADLAELAEHLPAWVARAAGSGGIKGWHAFLRAYADAFAAAHAPVALLPQGSPELTARLLVRQGGLASVVRPATPAEYAAAGSVCGEQWARLSAADSEPAAALLGAAAAVGAAAGGPFLARLLLACAQQGASAEAEVLPAVVDALTAAGRTGSGAAAEAWYADWRAACRRLPLDLLRSCGSLAEGGRLGAAVEGCLALVRNQEGQGRLASRLGRPRGSVRQAALAAAAQVCEAQLQAAAQLALGLLYMARTLGWGGTLGGAGAPAAAAGAVAPSATGAADAAPAPAIAAVARTLEAAALGYWAATTPGAPDRGDEPADPARMVMSLTIDEAGELAEGRWAGRGWVVAWQVPIQCSTKSIQSHPRQSELTCPAPSPPPLPQATAPASVRGWRRAALRARASWQSCCWRTSAARSWRTASAPPATALLAATCRLAPPPGPKRRAAVPSCLHAAAHPPSRPRPSHTASSSVLAG